MSVLYIVLPLAILIAIAAVAAFVWMVKGGQLDDLDTPALRILHDEAPRRPTEESAEPTSSDEDEPRRAG
jgi:cbb3-type cytochrome oxidase maturation protein